MTFQAFQIICMCLTALVALVSLRISLKKNGVDDEATLTERIARSRHNEEAVRKIAEATCAASFQGRGPWVKELAREVFNEQLQTIQNQELFVDTRSFKEFRGSLEDKLD